MATILETLKKFGVELPGDMLQVTSEDLPYLMFAAQMPGPNKDSGTFSLLVAMAVRIEQLENELFAIKFEEKE